MKINKLFGVKSITNLIYGILLFIPFASILSRVIYVQANPYAKDSYTGSISYLDTVNYSTYINSKQIPFVSYTDGQYTNYTLTSTSFKNFEINRPRSNVNESVYLIGLNTNSIIVNGSEYNNIQSVILGSTDRDIFFFATYDVTINTNFYIHRIDWRNAELLLDGVVIQPLYSDYFNTIQVNLLVNANLVSNVIYSSSNITSGVLSYSKLEIYLNDNTLSNAFEYSIQSFTVDNNLGNVNFFSWFTNLFLNQDNHINAVYLGFTNWYLNYALLVSSGYLLFFALMWFINYVRKMLEKASYHDFGGF